MKLMAALEKKMPKEFLDVAVASGYCTQVTKNMTAAFCSAMYDDVNIGTKQQRVLNNTLLTTSTNPSVPQSMK